MQSPPILESLRRHDLDRIPADWPARLAGIDGAAVARHLRRPIAPFTLERLAAFLSPAAAPHLEAMAQAAHTVTLQRFGRTVSLYAPMYLSNVCINRCRYCGFNAGHDAARRRLSLEEAEAEATIIAEEGFRDLLLVAGEDPAHVTVPYLTALAGRLRSRFASLSVEIEPLAEEAYRALLAAGIDGVTLYQETYDPATYAACHEGGPKADYAERLRRQDGAGRAGMRRLGIGALLGLADWRYEALCLGLHAQTLMKAHWRARVSISFPRMRDTGAGRPEVPAPVSDRDLTQMLIALRLCFPDVALVLSTREPAALRDRLLPLGVTQMSAGSKTNPGGYGQPERSAEEASAPSASSTPSTPTGGGEGDAAGEQFSVADERSAAEVAAMLRARGYEPVWKDWDAAFTADRAAPSGARSDGPR